MTVSLRRVVGDAGILVVTIPAVVFGCVVGFPAIELWVRFMLADAYLPSVLFIETVLRTALFWLLVGGSGLAAYWRWG